MDPSLLKICSALMIPNKPINQPTFSFTNWARELPNAQIIHICGPCAHTCFGFDPQSPERHPDIDILDDTRELKKPFICGCKNLKKSGHKCYWADCCREDIFASSSSSSSSSSPQEEVLPFVENAWRRESRAFLEDMAYNADMDDAFISRSNAKSVEKMTKSLRQQQELFDQYFEEDTQAAARRCIPIAKLVHRAKLALQAESAKEGEEDKAAAASSPEDFAESSSTNIYQALTNPELHDHILRQLLHWFKNDFFKWVDQPLCEQCGQKTQSYRPPREKANSVVPIPEEKQNWASVIELYVCKNCGGDNNIIRFPRYNKAKRLLTWRKGRCGEWTNCFALCCIALGFETRFVLDLTDHVWVEVYSNSRKRWVHLDPCENAFDAPLMYSKGWGKNLNYIFAISQTEIVDVIRRYTENPASLETRSQLSEMSLSHLVRGMNWFANKRCSPEKLALLEHRAILEREQLSQAGGDIIRGEDKSGATGRGRQSGSSSWTLSRNEGGSTMANDDGGKNNSSSIIGLTSADQNGMSTLDSVSAHAGSLFSLNENDDDEQNYQERIKKTNGGMGMIQFSEEAVLMSSSSSSSSSSSLVPLRPRWIWKGTRANVVQLFLDKKKSSASSEEGEEWFAFRFASGSGCQLSMLPPSTSDTTSTTSTSDSSSSSCTLPPWTTHSSASLPSKAQNDPSQLMPYPTREMLSSPRLPVPFSADRLRTVVDEFCCSLWFVPYFLASNSSNNKIHRGIIGFSVGKTFRADVSWEFKEEEEQQEEEEKQGTLKIALCLRHIDLPLMSSPEQQQAMKTKKWNENFSAIEPISIWDSKQGKAHVSSSSSSGNQSRKVVFQKVTAKSMLSVKKSDKDSNDDQNCYVLKSSSAIQLFVAMDKQGALTGNVYQKVENNTNKNNQNDDDDLSIVSCATAGSMIPLFLADRGAVSMKIHGLETLLESVQLGW